MKISDLFEIVSTYQYYAGIRSSYLESAKKIISYSSISLSVDGHFICDLRSIHDVSFVSNSILDIIFHLVFESDSSLRSFCLDNGIDYEPITDQCYLDWYGSKFQSK